MKVLLTVLGLPRRFPRVCAAIAVAASILGTLLAADWWIALPEGETADYMGRGACVGCHAKEAELWAQSDHARAMDLATPETVLGDFNDRQHDHFGVVSRMSRRGDEFFMTTDNRQGRKETFKIKYVLGYRPLQQYLVELADGRIQCLPIAWDVEGKRWFHLYPDEPIPHDDPLHWTRSLQNWNYMCADCHVTNLRKDYDVAADRYRTTFSEINVSCETCHGPGSLHVKLAEKRRVFWDRRYGYGLTGLKDKDSRVPIETCAPCHAHRRVVYPGFKPGEKFLDYYLPALLDGDLYYPDGQILEEDYEYTSFLQSRMYHQKVRCTNCHDPHTMRVKYPDNRLCGQCHLPSKYDTPAHHHHPDAEKPGTRCTECHMPKTPYMVVDPRLDHSIRIPRPDLTVTLGIPNACTGCHHDPSKGETPQWSDAKVEEWYGKRKGLPHFAYAIDAGRKGKPEAVDELLAVLKRKETRTIVRASVIALLGNYPQSAEARAAAVEALGDPEPLVRAAAVRAVESLPADELDERLSPLLRDPLRAVRTEAARVLSKVPDQYRGREDQAAFDSALAEYLAGQEYLGDQPAAHLNMAVIYANRGLLAEAEEEYRRALRIDPGFTPAGINLAMLLDQRDKKAEAEKQFRSVIEEIQRQVAMAQRQSAAIQKHRPSTGAGPRPIERMVEQLRSQEAEAHYSIGLLLAEKEDRLKEATQSLAAAANLAPVNPRIHYNLGLACQKLGRVPEAEKALATASRLAPDSPDYLKALAIFYTQQGKWESAVEVAQRLVILTRGDSDSNALLQQILRESNGGKAN